LPSAAIGLDSNATIPNTHNIRPATLGFMVIPLRSLRGDPEAAPIRYQQR
jgi:hypothetical protein